MLIWKQRGESAEEGTKRDTYQEGSLEIVGWIVQRQLRQRELHVAAVTAAVTLVGLAIVCSAPFSARRRLHACLPTAIKVWLTFPHALDPGNTTHTLMKISISPDIKDYYL